MPKKWKKPWRRLKKPRNLYREQWIQKYHVAVDLFPEGTALGRDLGADLVPGGVLVLVRGLDRAAGLALGGGPVPEVGHPDPDATPAPVLGKGRHRGRDGPDLGPRLAAGNPGPGRERGRHVPGPRIGGGRLAADPNVGLAPREDVDPGQDQPVNPRNDPEPAPAPEERIRSPQRRGEIAAEAEIREDTRIKKSLRYQLNHRRGIMMKRRNHSKKEKHHQLRRRRGKSASQRQKLKPNLNLNLSQRRSRSNSQSVQILPIIPLIILIILGLRPVRKKTVMERTETGNLRPRAIHRLNPLPRIKTCKKWTWIWVTR
jgi:hypothetical protein